MIRRSILSVVLSLVAVAAFSGVAAAQSKTQNVDANINSALQLDLDGTTVPAPWNLTSGVTNVMSTNAGTGGIILTAHANVLYTIRQNCDVGGKSGFDQSLFEANGGAYVGTGLHINAHLQLRALPAGTLSDVSTNPAGLALSGAQAAGATAAQPYNVELSQLVDFGDQRLTNVDLYHMVITFTIIAGST